MAMPSTPRPSLNRPLIAILFMCATTVVLFPSLNTAMKHLASIYGVPEVIFMRSTGHMVIMLALLMPGHGFAIFRTQRLGWQLGRSALQGASTGLYTTALIFIPLTTATTVAFTAPLLVVALSGPMLGERVGPRRWAAVLVGFIGALIIIRPGGAVMHWADFLVIGSAACYAAYQLLTRRIALYDSSRTTGIYTIVVSLIVSAAIVPFFWTTPVSWIDWGLFASMGIAGGLGHFCMVKAYQYGQASMVGPFDYGQLIGAAVLGSLVFSEFPDLWTWIGAAILIASGIYIARREAVLTKRRQVLT
ncbi:MAG: DMT family transporter [Alphaproteobacteria bacterium]|nr:DMT family transporter [Alphaproteobacteria bacterium]